MLSKSDKEEIRKAFEKVMDNRDTFFRLLSEFKKKHGFIPEKYQSDHRTMSALAEYETIGGWRDNPIAKLIINMAIKKALKNGQPLSEIDPKAAFHKTEDLLKDKLIITDKIYKEIEKAKKERKKALRKQLTSNQARRLRRKLKAQK